MTTTPIFDELMQTPRWAKLFPEHNRPKPTAKKIPTPANLPKRRKLTSVTPKEGTV